MACEILIPNMAIRNLIREDKIHQVYSSMQAGQSDTGMQTMNQALITLVRNGILSKQDAMENSIMPDELVKNLQAIPDKAK